MTNISSHRFFGYGSLVNLSTHRYPGATRQTIQGWARAWRHTQGRDVAYLTAVPDTDAQIDGIMADVPGGDWAALDEREAAYKREHLPDGAQIYHIPHGMHQAASTANPILLSYLDVVVQGYLQQFGEDGVARFFQSTHGWDAPILDDRASPRYPRARVLSPLEITLVEDHLAHWSNGPRLPG